MFELPELLTLAVQVNETLDGKVVRKGSLGDEAKPWGSRPDLIREQLESSHPLTAGMPGASRPRKPCVSPGGFRSIPRTSKQAAGSSQGEPYLIGGLPAATAAEDAGAAFLGHRHQGDDQVTVTTSILQSPCACISSWDPVPAEI